MILIQGENLISYLFFLAKIGGTVGPGSQIYV